MSSNELLLNQFIHSRYAYHTDTADIDPIPSSTSPPRPTMQSSIEALILSKNYSEALYNISCIPASSSKLHHLHAECLYGQEDYQQALEWYNRALENPNAHSECDVDRILFDRAYCRAKLDQHELALQDYTASIETNKADPDEWAYFHRGWSYFSLGQVDNAINDFNFALEHWSHDVPDSEVKTLLFEAWMSKGKKYYKDRRYTEAVSAITKALSYQNESDWKAKHVALRATCLLELKRFEEAVEGFTTAHDIDPRDVTWLVNRAYVLYKLRYFDGALEDYYQALSIQPKCEKALLGVERAILAKEGCKESGAKKDDVHVAG